MQCEHSNKYAQDCEMGTPKHKYNFNITEIKLTDQTE